MRTLSASGDLPEHVELLSLADEAIHAGARVEDLAQVEVRNMRLPVLGFTLGSTDPDAPVLGLFAGVHGLERIGTRVLTAWLTSLVRMAKWDKVTQESLQRLKIIAIPLVNPGGMVLKRRANPAGVDLMRNAPVEMTGNSRIKIAAGHRISPRLPWYRGQSGTAMEPEAQALCSFVARHTATAPVSVTMDIHSGFGTIDRLWLPYAKSSEPFPNLAEAYALKRLLDETHPHHVYCIEPQSVQYTTHGDLWDFLYDTHRAIRPEQLFIPFALEMGSWTWIKKNPRQLFTVLGAFNPLIAHRHQRILRRHITLITFLQRAVIGHEVWSNPPEETKRQLLRAAMNHWYAKS